MLQPVRILVWIISIAAAAMFLVLAAVRLGVPLPLTAAEGAIMEHVLRVSAHQALYTEPTLRYIAYPIMPGFPAIVALLARVVDAAIWEPRLVSILAACFTGALAVRIVLLETQSWTLAIAGGGLFFMASGGIVGPYDLGRPEPLMLLLALLGLSVLRFGTGLLTAAASAVLLAAAVMTQLEAGWFALAAIIHLAINDRKRLIVLGPLVVALSVAGFVFLDQRWGHWLSFYAWDVPVHALKFDGGQLVMFVRDMLLRSFGAVTVAVLLSCAMPKRPWVGRDGVWMAMASAGLIIALISTLNPLADPASRMSLVLGFAIFGPLALHVVVKHLGAWPGSSRTAGQHVMVAVLCLQLFALVHDPTELWPAPGSREAEHNFNDWLRSRPEQILAPGYGYAAWRAGKGSAMNLASIEALTASPHNRLMANDPTYLQRMLLPLRRGPDRPALLTDASLDETGELFAPLEESYELEDARIMTHARSVPRASDLPAYLYLPRDPEGLFRTQAPAEGMDPPLEQAAPDSLQMDGVAAAPPASH